MSAMFDDSSVFYEMCGQARKVYQIEVRLPRL